MRAGWWLLGFGASLAPVWWLAPRPEADDSPDSVEGLVARCRASGLSGHALADEAVKVTARSFNHDSLWHLAERPETSLRKHRGWSHQYNTILLMVLRELGFRARLVHAARVRGFDRPWWLAGHTWVKVLIDGHELAACASGAGSSVGAVPFVALTPELPLRRVTRWAVGSALVPFVVVEVWRALLLRRPVAEWLYAPKPKERIN